MCVPSIVIYKTNLPETNIVPENGWLKDYFPFGMTYLQGQNVSFRECIKK